MRLIMNHKAGEFLAALADSKLAAASTFSPELTISEISKLDLARTLIEQKPFSPPSLEQLISDTGLPRKRLNRGFKLLYGQTIRAFTAGVRLDAAREMLLKSNMSVGEVSDACGFENPNNFTRAFKTKFQSSPRAYRSR
nr:AraC family transcriptional regulator [Hyphomonas sp. Mor2]